MAASSKSVRLDSLQAQRIAAGHSVSRLAQLANVSDHTITSLEAIRLAGGPRIGGTCSPDEADRIAAALGVSLGTLGKVDHGG